MGAPWWLRSLALFLWILRIRPVADRVYFFFYPACNTGCCRNSCHVEWWGEGSGTTKEWEGSYAENVVGMGSPRLQYLEDLAAHGVYHCLAEIGTLCVNFLVHNFKIIRIPPYLSLVFGRSKLWAWLVFKWKALWKNGVRPLYPFSEVHSKVEHISTLWVTQHSYPNANIRMKSIQIYYCSCEQIISYLC